MINRDRLVRVERFEDSAGRTGRPADLLRLQQHLAEEARNDHLYGNKLVRNPRKFTLEVHASSPKGESPSPTLPGRSAGVEAL